MPRFLRYWLPVLLWAALIALLSRSDFYAGFTLRVLEAVAGWLDLPVSAATLALINRVVRKLAHVTEYFVLGLLVWRAWRESAGGWRRWSAVGVLALGMLWAAADELHQLFEARREGSLADVGYDTAGVLLALLVAYVWGKRAAEAPPSS